MILSHRAHPEAVVPLRPSAPVALQPGTTTVEAGLRLDIQRRDERIAALEAELAELVEANAGLAEALAAAGPKGRAKASAG